MKTLKIRIIVLTVVIGWLMSGTLLAQKISNLRAVVVDTAATLTITVTFDDPAASKTIFVQVDEADGPAVFAKAFPVVLVNDDYYLKDGDVYHPLQPGVNQFFFPIEAHSDQLRLTFFTQNSQGSYSKKLSATVDQK